MYVISTLVMLLLLEATSTARKWKEKNESVSFQPSATTSARDDECSSNGSDQINTKCGKTQLMCRVTLNTLSAPGEHTLQWRKESGKVLATQPSPRVRDAPAKPQKKTLSETAHLKKSFLSLSFHGDG